MNSTKTPQFYRAKGYLAQESVGYLMRRSVNQISQEIDRRMEPMGLTNAQWVPLLKMHMGHASTAAELARTCEMDAGAMTRLLDRLEAKGLCMRTRSADDRRIVKLELSEEGSKAAQAIPQVLSDVQNACLAGFSAEEWQTLKGLLQRVLANAVALQGEPEKNNDQ
ncbi:MAG: MarR family transcriptional regulator [Comamonadaceae bacterium]|nr:MAG: MarR family transcriptional regulator [Comamonadaceae bacterium]